nr:hypothetical protein [Tanacetum cinerariifolium]
MTMATTIEQQVALDEALVLSTQRLRIGRSNFRFPSDIQSKESTLQLVYDVLRRCLFFKAFLVTADVPKIYMQEFWATAYVHQRSIRFKMNNKNTLNMATIIEQKTALDESLVPSTHRLRIGRSNFRLPSDIQSKEATLQVVYDVLRNSPLFRAFQVTADVPEIYMQEFWATAKLHHNSIRFKIDTRKSVLDLKAFREMLHISPRILNQPFADLPTKEEILDFLRLRLQDIKDMLLLLVQGKLSNLTVEERFAFNIYKFKEVDFKMLRLQDIKDMLLLLVQGKLSNLTVEERLAFNVSLRMFTRSIIIKRRVEDLQLGQESSSVSSHFMTSMLNPPSDAGMEPIFATASSSVASLQTSTQIMTPSIIATITTISHAPIPPTTIPQTNPFAEAVSNILGIVYQYMNQQMNEAVRVAVQIQTDRLHDSYQRENDEFLRTIDENMKRIIKEQVKGQVKEQVSRILPRIEQSINAQLEAKVLTRSSHLSRTSYAVAVDLSEMELKKILIEMMEGNKSIQCSDEQRNLYKALVDAYEADKTILDSYGETVILKRRRDDDDDQDEGPSAGSDRGSKRRREEDPVQTTSQMDEPSYLVFETATDDQPIVQSSQHHEWFSQPKKPPTPDRDWNKTLPAVQGSTQTWISELAKQADSRSSFNELLDTPLDLSKFIMNRLRVYTLTPELLAGPTFELMKGSCTSLIELEYHLEEVYKATTDQLDSVNPEGQQYPHNLLHPLLLILDNRGRRVIPFAHFINNDLEYLRGGAFSRKYTTSVTKIKAADYGQIKWIEDLGRKRQQFYGFAVNWESALDVYSKRRIISVTDLKIVQWHSYKHLDWITVRRDDDKLYKFKEGDFKRLRLQDIEDMLLLLVQGKLSNLTVEERFAFNVSLRMFTQSIVIQLQVKKVNVVVQLRALIDGKKEIFEELARMGYEKPPLKLTFYKAFFSTQWKFLIHTLVQYLSVKRTAWNKFSYSMASVVICLATVVIDNQVDGMTTHNTSYTSPAFTHKVFANMRRVGKGFSGVETPLFASMLVQPQPQAEVPIAHVPPSTIRAPLPTDLQDPTPTPHATPPQDQPLTPHASPPQEQPTTPYESLMPLLTTLLETSEEESKEARKEKEVKVFWVQKAKKGWYNLKSRILYSYYFRCSGGCTQTGGKIAAIDADEDITLVDVKKDEENMLEIIPVPEFKVKALQVKYPIIDWEIHTKGSRVYWKIIRVGGIAEAYQVFEDMLKGFDREDLVVLWILVKEKFSSAMPSVDKEKAL